MTDGKLYDVPMAGEIALSPDGKTLYWQARTGKTLYRIGTEALQSAGNDPS